MGETYTVNVTATDSSLSSLQIAEAIEVVKGPADPHDLNRNVPQADRMSRPIDAGQGTWRTTSLDGRHQSETAHISCSLTM